MDVVVCSPDEHMLRRYIFCLRPAPHHRKSDPGLIHPADQHTNALTDCVTNTPEEHTLSARPLNLFAEYDLLKWLASLRLHLGPAERIW
jgi:hypothetical protein